MKKFVMVVAVLLCLLMLAGCGKSVTLKTDDGDVKVQSDGDGISVQSEDGKSEIAVAGDDGDSVSLPDDYPKDLVPIADGAKIVMATKSEDENKKVSYWVMYSTKEKAKDLYSYYQDALKDLTETQKLEMNGVYSISGVNGENNIAVTVAPDESNEEYPVSVQISISPK